MRSRRILLGDQSLCWARVPLHSGRVIEFTHYFVELLSVYVRSRDGLTGRMARRDTSLYHDTVELVFEVCSAQHQVGVLKLVRWVPSRKAGRMLAKVRLLFVFDRALIRRTDDTLSRTKALLRRPSTL